MGRTRPRREDDLPSDPIVIGSLRDKAFLLEYVTGAWNIFEGIAAILVGLGAGSVALVGFGLDSIVEVFASLVVVVELRRGDRKREGLAVRLIGSGYLVVAAYILWDSLQSLALRDHPSGSPLGIALTTATVAAMISLALGKRWVGSRLQSQTVLADAQFSLIDGMLAATVLAGLVLNFAAGLWWADPVFAMLIALAAGREGIGSFRQGGSRR